MAAQRLTGPFAYICNTVEAISFAGVVMASGGLSSEKSFGFGREKGGRKGPPVVWEGSIGPDFFSGSSV